MSPGRALEDAARRCVAAAQREGRTQWLAWRRAQPPGDLLDALDPQGEGDGFFYETPEEDTAVAATGSTLSFEAEGDGRFRAIDAALRDFGRLLHVAGDPDAPPEAGPLLVGGFGFSDTAPADEAWKGFPAARLVLPRVAYARRGDRAWCCSVRAVNPKDDPQEVARELADTSADLPARPRHSADVTDVRLLPTRSGASHRTLVARALEAVRAGALDKVVVARALDVERDAPFDASALLRILRAQHPACAVFGVRRKGAWLAGATPERLLRRRGDLARAVVLAGSAPRGRSPEEDARLRDALLASEKERTEHAIVVRAMHEGLAPLCRELRTPDAPQVLALGGVQHLWTPLEGVLKEPCGLLEIAGRIHPTPAVAGAPRDAALAWLGAHEGLERGWYGGLVGWLSLRGDGELSAALRCALLRGCRARLFAGGGIVPGSSPEAERMETRLKWDALLPALLEL